MNEKTAATVKAVLMVVAGVAGAMSVPLLADSPTHVLVGTGLSALSFSLVGVLVPAPGTHQKIVQASMRPPPFKSKPKDKCEDGPNP